MKALQIPRTVRELVLHRDGHCCARCGRSTLNYPSSLHHRRPRGMGGSRDERINDPRNIVRVCGSGVSGCHGEIEGNRSAAKDTGWLIPSLAHLDTPLITIHGTRIVLSADGGREDVWPQDDRLPSEVTG